MNLLRHIGTSAHRHIYFLWCVAGLIITLIPIMLWSASHTRRTTFLVEHTNVVLAAMARDAEQLVRTDEAALAQWLLRWRVEPGVQSIVLMDGNCTVRAAWPSIDVAVRAQLSAACVQQLVPNAVHDRATPVANYQLLGWSASAHAIAGGVQCVAVSIDGSVLRQQLQPGRVALFAAWLMQLGAWGAGGVWLWRQSSAQHAANAATPHVMSPLVVREWIVQAADLMPQGVLLLDPQQRVVMMNAAARAWFAGRELPARPHLLDLAEALPWGAVLVKLLDGLHSSAQRSAHQSMVHANESLAISVARLETGANPVGYWITCEFRDLSLPVESGSGAMEVAACSV